MSRIIGTAPSIDGEGFSSRIPTNHVEDELADRRRITQDVYDRHSRIGTNRFQKHWPASNLILAKPEPEIEALARAPDRSPCASDDSKIQEYNRVRRSKPDLGGIIGSEIAVHDPPAVADEFLLDLDPTNSRCGHKPRLPKDLVQFYHTQPRDLTQPSGECRFARGSRAENQDAVHALYF